MNQAESGRTRRRSASSRWAGSGSSASTRWCSSGEGQLLLVDAGMLFPPAETCPASTRSSPTSPTSRSARDRVRGILLTHGHEDHIGALSLRAQRRARARLRQPPDARLRAQAPARARRQRRPARALAGPARRARPLPRAPDPRGPQRPRQPAPSPSRRRPASCSRAATSRSTPTRPPEERTDLEALAAVGRPRRAGPALRQHERRAAGLTTGGEDDGAPRLRGGPRAHARARPRLLLRHLDPAHPARGRPRGARPTARWRSSAGGWSTTPRWRSTSACCGSPESVRLTPGALSGEAGRRAVVLRLGQPGRAALGPVDDQRRRAPRHRRRARRHRRPLRRAPIPGNERAVSRLIGNLFRLGCDVVHAGHRAGARLRPRQPGRPRRAPPRASGRATSSRSTASTACWRSTRGSPPRPGSPPSASCSPRTATCSACRPRGPGARRGWPPAASCSTAAAPRRSRTSSCATAATSRRRGSSSRSWSWTARPGTSSRRPRSSPAGSWTPAQAAELADEAGRLLAGALDARPPRSGSTPRSPASACAESSGASSSGARTRRPMVIPVVMEV